LAGRARKARPAADADIKNGALTRAQPS